MALSLGACSIGCWRSRALNSWASAAPALPEGNGRSASRTENHSVDGEPPGAVEQRHGVSPIFMICSTCAAQQSRASRFSRSNEYFTYTAPVTVPFVTLMWSSTRLIVCGLMPREAIPVATVRRRSCTRKWSSPSSGLVSGKPNRATA
jgi:hypothetical protein